MNLNATDYEARSLGDFLGITKEKLAVITIKSAPDVKRYVNEIIVNDEMGSPENRLFKALINNCNTIEEALFMSYCFKDVVETILQNTDFQIRQN